MDGLSAWHGRDKSKDLIHDSGEMVLNGELLPLALIGVAHYDECERMQLNVDTVM